MMGYNGSLVRLGSDSDNKVYTVHNALIVYCCVVKYENIGNNAWARTQEDAVKFSAEHATIVYLRDNSDNATT